MATSSQCCQYTSVSHLESSDQVATFKTSARPQTTTLPCFTLTQLPLKASPDHHSPRQPWRTRTAAPSSHRSHQTCSKCAKDQVAVLKSVKLCCIIKNSTCMELFWKPLSPNMPGWHKGHVQSLRTQALTQSWTKPWTLYIQHIKMYESIMKS